jgi:four helix bundle protein
MQDFRKLDVWQLAKQLTVKIYSVTKTFPSSEMYGLVSQMRRAASGSAANIAEGSGRNTSKDFANFLNISIGSLCELESYIEIAYELKYLDTKMYTILVENIDEIRRKIINLNKKLRT